MTVLPGAEITLEANPGTLTPEKLRIYKECGVNRISLGVQSMQERERVRSGGYTARGRLCRP